MTDFTEIRVEIPVRTYEKLSEVAAKSGMTLDDLVGGACEMVYTTPTQSIIKRVLRLAHGLKIEKVLSAFPKTRKEGNEEPTEE